VALGALMEFTFEIISELGRQWCRRSLAWSGVVVD
jgi:hypothetical protein